MLFVEKLSKMEKNIHKLRKLKRILKKQVQKIQVYYIRKDSALAGLRTKPASSIQDISSPLPLYPPLPYSIMLPAQLVNVAEAALGEMPTPKEFLQRVTKAIEPQYESAVDSALFGDTFKNVGAQQVGSEKNQKGGLKALLDFQKVLDHKGVEITDLDDYFVNFAKCSESAVPF